MGFGTLGARRPGVVLRKALGVMEALGGLVAALAVVDDRGLDVR